MNAKTLELYMDKWEIGYWINPGTWNEPKSVTVEACDSTDNFKPKYRCTAPTLEIANFAVLAAIDKDNQIHIDGKKHDHSITR